MGIPNCAVARAACPYCAHRQRWTVQFKYGSSRHVLYPDDTLEWDKDLRSSDGIPTEDHVYVGGTCTNACRNCGKSPDAKVFFNKMKFRYVELSRDFVDTPLPEGFVRAPAKGES